MRKFIVFILLLLVSLQPCYAEDWIKITDKKYTQIDSIENTNQGLFINFWDKHLNDKNKLFTHFENLYKAKVWYVLNFTQVDCKNKKFYIQDTYIYDLKGNVLGSYFKQSLEFRIVPNSYGEIYLEACKHILNKSN